MNPLDALAQHGQSIWLDHVHSGMMREGWLSRCLQEGVRGLVCGPPFFSPPKASDLAASRGQTAVQVYKGIAARDIRAAADALRPVYDRTDRIDGYVSLEIAPSLARDPDGTVEQGQRLWHAIDRPNLMLKVPGTPECLSAIEALLGHGINVNVTHIYSRGAYHSIADAFLRGAQIWIEQGEDPGRLASVASFMVEPVDAEVDRRIADAAAHTSDASHRRALQQLAGKAAIASAKLAYEIFQRVVDTPQWRALAQRGVRPQRLLWSHGRGQHDSPAGLAYVEPLVGPDTIHAMAPPTLATLRGSRAPSAALASDLTPARDVLGQLEAVGISMGAVTDELLERGVEQAEDAVDGLLGTIADALRLHRGTRLNRLQASLPPALADAVGEASARWDAHRRTKALWDRNASLWTDSGEETQLGWLDIVDRQRHELEFFANLAAEVAEREFEDVIVLGMGGSTLTADLLSRVYGNAPGFPPLTVLDSTDPAQVRATEEAVDLRRTLFVVASKSGTTIELRWLLAYFYARVQAVMPETAAQQFIAVTDRGSELEAFARAEGFWRVHHGVPDIGGRYSAFSNFGMIPAAAMGLPTIDFLQEAALMVGACGNAAVRDNPGVELGLILGTAALAGRNKLTLVTTPALAPLGAWIEHLVAGSTSSQGRGMLVQDREPLLEAGAYRDDRVFVYLRLDSTPHLDQDHAVQALADAGHAVVRIELDDVWSLSQELARWQFASAVAGAVMGVDPFDQAAVEASKARAGAIMAQRGAKTESTGAPLWSSEGIALFGDPKNATVLRRQMGAEPTLSNWLRAHLSRLRPRDHMALLAFIPMTAEHQRALHDLRSVVLEATGAATSVGFGPRFLHGTGQTHKTGGNNGVFLQLTCSDGHELPIPGYGMTFGEAKAAQAQADLESLANLGRRVLRIHLSGDIEGGLQTLLVAAEAAFAAQNLDFDSQA